MRHAEPSRDAFPSCVRAWPRRPMYPRANGADASPQNRCHGCMRLPAATGEFVQRVRRFKRVLRPGNRQPSERQHLRARVTLPKCVRSKRYERGRERIGPVRHWKIERHGHAYGALRNSTCRHDLVAAPPPHGGWPYCSWLHSLRPASPRRPKRRMTSPPPRCETPACRSAPPTR